MILANSNPATIMTDPDFADATYVEPLDVEILTKIIEREQPDALLPTLGGQTALNLAMELVEAGVLDEHGVELIGAKAEAIATAEDREQFKQAMIEIGLGVPASGIAHTLDEAMVVVEEIGLPVIIRPAYILGGRGTGMASTPEEFAKAAHNGLEASPISEILIEQSIAGWKEFELEVMRDRADNCVVICSIENVDPMGVHTGDSITVAPAQTLSDVEYQAMRDAAFACLRRVGVETGGSNVQFALDPTNGEMVVIEMNPRVSRSSALASKATGFPIAKIAARLAVGYTLDEIPNDITEKTPACFEPTIDYVVTKVPRWAFEKFPGQPAVLGTQMQSVGEAMAIGRTFPESLQKGLRSLEHGRLGLNCDPGEAALDELSDDELVTRASIATPDRPFQLEAALRRGISIDDLYEATKVDPWFLDQISMIVEERAHLAEVGLAGMGRGRLAAGQAAGVQRRPAGLALGRGPDGRPGRPARGRRAHDVQDGRHLRRRVRRPHAVPLLDLRGRGRGAPRREAEGDHPRLGPQPHRAGHRVRLLLRPRQLRPARRRLRDGDGQLQPGDRVDRLRHQRPALLRAAHPRGRAERHRGRGGVGRGEGRDRRPRRPDPAEAGRRPARGPRAGDQRRRPSTWPRTASAGTRCAPGWRSRSPPAAPRRRSTKRWPSSNGSATRCSCDRPTCSAAGPCRSSTTTRACAPPWPSWPASARWARRVGCRPSARSWSTGSWRTPSRSTWTPSATTPATASSAGSWSTSRRRACTPATAPA